MSLSRRVESLERDQGAGPNVNVKGELLCNDCGKPVTHCGDDGRLEELRQRDPAAYEAEITAYRRMMDEHMAEFDRKRVNPMPEELAAPYCEGVGGRTLTFGEFLALDQGELTKLHRWSIRDRWCQCRR